MVWKGMVAHLQIRPMQCGCVDAPASRWLMREDDPFHARVHGQEECQPFSVPSKCGDYIAGSGDLFLASSCPGSCKDILLWRFSITLEWTDMRCIRFQKRGDVNSEIGPILHFLAPRHGSRNNIKTSKLHLDVKLLHNISPVQSNSHSVERVSGN